MFILEAVHGVCQGAICLGVPSGSQKEREQHQEQGPAGCDGPSCMGNKPACSSQPAVSQHWAVPAQSLEGCPLLYGHASWNLWSA